MRTIVGWLILIWLLVGTVAGYQRGYYTGDRPSCARISTIAVTVVAGPLNYAGVNPKIKKCGDAPKPSK